MMNIERIREALRNIRWGSYDYYDGNHVWCRYCSATRPRPQDDAALDWHSEDCLYRIACEESLDE
jgi:hypothetical protein